ncbi:uncharacterized protein [Panulirus ornatus]|uniref:uncharacterized protein n=1 Tax=Panulirus ornatus TaxID=150431 RepID=UPI003A899D8B
MNSIKSSDKNTEKRRSPSKIPVVDLGELGVGRPGEPSEDEWRRVGAELAKAFIEIGFVYLSNHGIPGRKVDEVNKWSKEFFLLDPATKIQYKRGVHDIQGYTTPGQERLTADGSVQELRESYDVRRLDGVFPDEEVGELRPAVHHLVDDCRALATRVLAAIALGLGLERSFFVSKHQQMCSDNNATCLRLLYYPPVPSSVVAGATRCGAHTDYGIITLLFQDSIGGLEVRERDGSWVSADPMPDTILVNVGDILQFWTSDKFRATEHRVLIPEEEVRQKKGRQSVVFFVHPDGHEVIKPLDTSFTFNKLLTAREHTDKRFEETYRY